MIKDFIGVFENTLRPETCDYYIKHFEKLKALGFSYKRSAKEKGKLHKSDESINLLGGDSLSMLLLGIGGKNDHTNHFHEIFWEKYNEYADTYSILRTYPQHEMLSIKVQKTLPTEGYHIWHSENSAVNSPRVLAWMIYLNDVKEGGETEFLYQSVRVSPKKGTLVIWPAAFTHVHRGNPPLSGTKYIMTSWLEYCQP
jgi:hypothetical protein